MQKYKYTLSDACADGDLEKVKEFIKNGADVHADENLAVSYTGIMGRVEILKYFVDECNVDPLYDNGKMLVDASTCGRLEVIKYLIEECGADVSVDNHRALQEASRNGHLEVVKYLTKECGADVSANNHRALEEASRSGHLKVVRYLIEECGADVSANGYKAFEEAVDNKKSNTVRYMLEMCGVDATADDYSLFFLCAKYKRDLHTIQCFIDNFDADSEHVIFSSHERFGIGPDILKFIKHSFEHKKNRDAWIKSLSPSEKFKQLYNEPKIVEKKLEDEFANLYMDIDETISQIDELQHRFDV